jgi:hypothetical protein
MNRALEMFARAWVAFAIIVNLVAVVGFFWSAHSFWVGWQRVAATYSPYNIANYVMEVVLFSPAFGAYVWLERRKKRAARIEQPMSVQEAQQIINAYGDAMTKPASFPRELHAWPTSKDPAAQKPR